MPDAYKARQQSIAWARAVIERPNVVILDTESTGLNKGGTDEPVEIAIIDLHGSVLFNERLHPTVRIDLGAQLVHGIALEMLKNARSFRACYGELSMLLSRSTVLIFNSQFDTRLLESAAHNQNLPALEIRSECVMLKAAAFIGTWNYRRNGWRWPSLEAACSHFQIKPAQPAHSALGDCRSTLDVLSAMAKAKI